MEYSAFPSPWSVTRVTIARDAITIGRAWRAARLLMRLERRGVSLVGTLASQFFREMFKTLFYRT